jgi:excisionase family DNA binding protein
LFKEICGGTLEPSSLESYWGNITRETDLANQVTTVEETYTTSEAAEILHVSDQTIRRMCEAGKFLGATRTDGGHWRIPRKHFKIALDQSKQIDKGLADIRIKSIEGGQVDEFGL